MKPVRWGILSTALIGTQRVIPGMRKSKLLEVAAIASRSLATAEVAAASLGIPLASARNAVEASAPSENLLIFVTGKADHEKYEYHKPMLHRSLLSGLPEILHWANRMSNVFLVCVLDSERLVGVT